MATLHEHAAMRQALSAAATAGVPLGPNPRVGAVLLRPDGQVISVGYHRGAGTRHAEIDALAQAGDDARGATAVVTLEPCDHSGRTGPCSHALIAAGVRRVVAAVRDPNPAAAGGAETLRAAGIDVEFGVLADEAAQVNPAWLFAVTHARPLVTWKYAATLDGRSAAADGTSRWITGPAARRDVHRQRALVDAIVVGTGTVLADDPSLTVRLGDGDRAEASGARPVRVVVGHRRVPADAHVLDDTAPTLLLDTRRPGDVLAALHIREARHVWLEGGPTLAGAFLAADLIDRVVGYVAPVLLGSGAASLGDAAVATMADAHRFSLDAVSVVGTDIRLMLSHPNRPIPGAAGLLPPDLVRL